MYRYLFIFFPIFFSGCTTEPTTPSTARIRAEQRPPTATPEHQQLLVVITADWDAVPGKLRRFEWKEGTWQETGATIPVVVGKKGMGWGKGLEDFTSRTGPVKREGDLKSPAGVFRLGDAFGYAPAASVNWIKTGYKPVTAATMCIEDRSSAFYNQILDEGTVTADWNSTDHMLRKDDLYEWGMFVAHNSPEASPGGGSCIFLHVAQINDDGTAGCTAMSKDHIVEILRWIDHSQSPLLVQTPENQYDAIREMYNLPDIP